MASYVARAQFCAAGVQCACAEKHCLCAEPTLLLSLSHTQVGNVYSSQWILEAMYKDGSDYGHDGLGLLTRCDVAFKIISLMCAHRTTTLVSLSVIFPPATAKTRGATCSAKEPPPPWRLGPRTRSPI